MSTPVRREILVNALPERAFELFVGQIGAWWPLAQFGVFGDGTVAFERDLLIERSGEQKSVWGEVTEWSPPDALALTWHPGSDAAFGTDVRVTFEVEGDQTLVTLVHTGWERMSDPDAASEEYRNGWPAVLGGYAALVESFPGPG